MYYILNNKVSGRKNIIKKIIRENTFKVFIEKYPHISGSMQFKPMFKGQLYCP